LKKIQEQEENIAQLNQSNCDKTKELEIVGANFNTKSEQMKEIELQCNSISESLSATLFIEQQLKKKRN
jgi:hypothetical protein